MEQKKVRLVLVGLGGYGGQYIIFLREYVDPDTFEFVGVVDPYAKKASEYEWVCNNNIPIYQTLEEFYEKDGADLAIISTPIPLHKEQVIYAMEHGSHVLCEKPIAPLIQDALKMKEAAIKYQKLLGVGFQWSFGKPLLDFKHDILSGVFGRPLSVKALTSWKRYDEYYDIGGWKGHIVDEKGGWILDSVATNAASHYLSNLFFMLGDQMDTALMPEKVVASVYRAKEIQSFDTCFIKGSFNNGCKFYYIATHSGVEEQDPVFEFEFTNGVVKLSDDKDHQVLRAYFPDGSIKEYGLARSLSVSASKVSGMISAIQKQGIVTGTVDSVIPHITVTNAIFDQVDIATFPKELCHRVENPGGTFVHGLTEQCRKCYDDMLLPSEEGFSWAVKEKELDLVNYTRFSGQKYRNLRKEHGKKICIVGNSGHAVQFVKEGYAIENINFTGYCESYGEEDLGKLEAAFLETGMKPVKYNDYKEMIEREEPDVLIVDSLFRDHCTITCYALAHDINVFCEKPLALSLLACNTLEIAEQNSKATYWAMQTLRYEPSVYTAKKLLEQGAVGTIRMINCQKSYKLGIRPPFFSNREECGGMIPWVAIHGIDAIQYLCKNKFRSVFAAHSNQYNEGNGDLETTAICMFELEDGVIAHVNADYYRPETAPTHGDDRIRIVGTKGVLEVRDKQVLLIDESHDGTVPMELIPQEEIPTIFKDFLSSLSGEESGLLDAGQSLYSTKLALLARDSADVKEKITITSNAKKRG